MTKRTNKMGAKAAGMTRAAGKILKGETGILRHLAGEHGEVAALMHKLAKTDDEETCTELFEEIRARLTAHAEAEEAEFYPVLKRDAQLSNLVEQALEEHARIKHMLQHLEADALPDKVWEETFGRLQVAVEQHVRMEEDRIFPLAKNILAGDELKAMLERYEPVEHAVLERMH